MAAAAGVGTLKQWLLLATLCVMAPLQYSTSVHLAMLVLHASGLLLMMGLRIRTLSEAVRAAVDVLWQAELHLALLVWAPLSSPPLAPPLPSHFFPLLCSFSSLCPPFFLPSFPSLLPLPPSPP